MIPLNPQEHPQLRDPENVEKYRRIHCTNYNDCLKFAENQKWDGFHCNDCTAYQCIDLPRYKEDLAGICKLWRTFHRLYPDLFKMSDSEFLKSEE